MTATLLAPDDYAATVALASEATIRQRVYRQFAWDQSKANKLAYELSTIRLRGYDSRLAEIAREMGMPTATLEDAVTMDNIVQDSRGVAFQVLQTYNRDLKAFIAQQPRGASQAQLSASVREWANHRADWKTVQISKTELMEGRNQANGDVLAKNDLQLLQRATPQSAQCPQCKALVARGWMTPAQVDTTPPLHPGCVHSYEQRHLKDAVAAKSRIWLGTWVNNG